MMASLVDDRPVVSKSIATHWRVDVDVESADAMAKYAFNEVELYYRKKSSSLMLPEMVVAIQI